jgi:hypothetical protein
MSKKISKPDPVDPIELIESLHDLVMRARDSSPPISFIDSLALTSLTQILEYIDISIEIDTLDYRTKFFISEIRNFADSITFRLSNAMTTKGRLNYNYPLTFPLSCIITSKINTRNADDQYDWLAINLEQIETEGEFPDDIDSTWSALNALSVHSWRDYMLPARVFANSIRNLESVRRAEALHICNTWFSEDAEWESVDIVAMSSVAAFFDTVDKNHLTKTKSYIFEKLITYLRNPIESLWFSEFYHSLPLAIYMISRCDWSAEQNAEICSHLVQILRGDDPNYAANNRIRIENATDMSLYLSALMRLRNRDCDISEFKLLAESCMKADSINMTIPDPLYIHSLRDCKTTYAMSSVISSLVIFESMFGMMYFLKKEKTVTPPISATAPILSPYTTGHISLTEKVMEMLKSFEVLNGKSQMIEKLLSGTDFAICYDICSELLSDNAQIAENALTAHALGLCAYFLYDKIYDQELPPTMLPTLFLTNTVFQAELQHLLDDLEALHIDIPEQILSILPDTDISYYILSERGSDTPLFLHSRKSMGTCLIPILCMLRAGTSREAVAYVQEFFEHFNLARQISDDAKDAELDRSASSPKITTMSALISQRDVESSILRAILHAKHALDSIVRIATQLPDTSDGHDEDNRLHSIYYILRKHLDEFFIKVLRAKWELSVIRNL